MQIGYSGKSEVKLIVSRRAIAGGMAALMAGGGVVSYKKLAQLSNVPLSFDPADFSTMMRDGLFLPDYRHPMARIIFEDGKASGWQVWNATNKTYKFDWSKRMAIECCCPDSNGAPRYVQLRIG